MGVSARLLQPEPELGDAATRSALLELGADPAVELTDAERTQLLEQGYVNLGQLLTHAQCEEAKRRIRAQLDREAGSEENAARRAREPNNITHPDDAILGNVFNKCNYDGLFDVTVAHPKLLAAMWLMLGDHVRRFSLNVRGAAPGSGNQVLHTDWGKNPGALQDPPSYQITNSIWMLDEFTESNGATRVLPGSHRTGDGGQPPPSLVDAAGKLTATLSLPTLSLFGSVLTWNVGCSQHHTQSRCSAPGHRAVWLFSLATASMVALSM
jgi:ectoine hydroxylase-related dioxygenase (phytanoyl-CoA dioxygenase family)